MPRYEPMRGDQGLNVCDDCGSVVADTYYHTEWHERVEDASN